jgi:DNA repair protein RecO (recombination protein O)
MKDIGMPRTFNFRALILRTRPSGESNREIWMLTREEGILRATMFGGPKSRLRSHAAPFHSGQVWIYHDPVRDSRKLSDIDVQSWRPGLRELFDRTMSADAIAETILASHGGGGNWESALAIAEPVLDALEGADEELCARILVYFFWQWADLLGIRPDTDRCASCGKEIPPDHALRYSSSNNALYCPSCIASGENEWTGMAGGAGIAGEAWENFFPVNGGCRRWLETIQSLSPDQLYRYTMDAKSLREAKALTQAILAAALGKRPASWELITSL